MNDPKIYDEIYSVSGHHGEYAKPFTQSRYYSMWYQVMLWVKSIKHAKVLDVGCGVGQFAQVLISNGISCYHGIDFSKVAIDIAKKKYPSKFELADALNYSGYMRAFNIVCLLEVLEHVPHDKKLLARLKPGVHVILSVPNYASPTHVRFFLNSHAVKTRYQGLIKFGEPSFEFSQGNGKKIFLLKGIKL